MTASSSARAPASLVLESAEHAQARGARIYAEVLGAGITADAHDIAQPDPAGRGGARAILRACAEADIKAARDRAHQRARDLDPAGRHRRGPDDPRDARQARRRRRGHQHQVDDRPPARRRRRLETIATVLALYHRVAPPTINLDNLDPQVELDIADQGARPARRATSPR